MSLLTNLISYWKLDGDSTDEVASNDGTDTSITYGVENLTGYTEVDTSGYLTVTAPKVNVVNAQRNGNPAYVIKDFGAGYFNALDIDFKIYLDSATSSMDAGITIGNTANETLMNFASTDISAYAWESLGVRYISLRRGAYAADDAYEISANTIYYCTLSRATSNNTVNLLIYSDSGRTNLLHTCSLTGFGTTTYRYFYSFSMLKDTAGAYYWTGYITDIIIGGVSYGKINQGAGFNGTTSKIVMGAEVIPDTGNYSINIWWKSAGFPAGTALQQLIANDTSGGGGVSVDAYGNSDSPIFRIANAGAGGTQIDYATSNYTVGTWYMMTITYDGTDLRFYSNNTLIDTHASAINTTTTNMSLGYSIQAGARFWNGAIDEVGIWSRALTSGEVSQLYNHGNGLPYPLSLPSPFPTFLLS